MKMESSEYQTFYSPEKRINHHDAEQETLYKVTSDILYSLIDSEPTFYKVTSDKIV